jgi:hypothetical protein
MTSLTAAQLFDVWERGLPLGPVGRPVALLAAASELGRDRAVVGAADPSDEVEVAADLPVGVRDTRLLDLIELAFGPTLDAVVSCPGCGEDLELACTVEQLRAGPAASPGTVRTDGFEVRVRPPDSRDLAAIALLGEPEQAQRELLRRCVAVLDAPGGPTGSLALEELPDHVVSAAEWAILAADPQAEGLVEVTCQLCGHSWEADFDVATFLWARLDAWARRFAVEVHTLASAYGWREPDILALSSSRRALYLGLAGT